MILSNSSALTYAEETDTLPLLSEMSESECIAFVKENDIEIPELYDDEAQWGAFIKNTIILFENNPDMVSPYSYVKTSEFFLAIGKAVNEYYGTNSPSSAAFSTRNLEIYPIDELTCSTVYGSWSDNFENYNCYAFALGIIDEKIDPGVYDYIAKNPDVSISEYRENFSLTGLDVADIANLVYLDLFDLNCSRVTIQAHQMSTANMCTNESIICVKIGDIDYHFMRYVNGIWLHKPGGTQILQYNSTPNSTDDWPHEFVHNGQAYRTDAVYDSDVYFISYNGHDWDYMNNYNGTHIRTCSICDNVTVVENCDLKYVYSSSNYHKMVCSDCGYTVTGLACDFEYAYTGDGTSTHTHSGTCQDCGHVSTGTCSFAFSYCGTNNGTHQHINTCTVCGETTGLAIACTYLSGSNNCRFCGHNKNAIVTALRLPTDAFTYVSE